MATNKYFSQGARSEQVLYEDLIVESLKMYGQDVYLKDTVDSERSFKFGCLSLDGESAIVLYEGGYAYAKLSGLSSKPARTKEEAELEEAKKKQLSDIGDDLCREGVMKYSSDIGLVLEYMQNSGFLAEMLLPLESK